MAQDLGDTPPPGVRSPVIPWHRYANGNFHRLTPDVDFHQEPEKARGAAIQWGWKHGYRVNSGIDPDTGDLTVRFTRKRP